MRANRLIRDLAVIAILAAVYFVAGKLGLMIAFVHPSATAVWPPTGIALAAFLLLGYRVWPGILLGAFLVNMTTAGTVATSMGIATGNTLEGLLGAYLINGFANGRYAFNRPEDISKFTFLAGMACTVSATLGVTSLSLGGFSPWADYGSVWFTWWIGDSVGAIIVTPFLVLWGLNPRVQWTRNQIFEASLLLLGLVLIGQSVFWETFFSENKHYPLEFMCVPFLIWTAFRFGQRESATAVFVLSVIAVLGTVKGFGPFVKETQNESLLLLQAFMGVIGVTTLVLGAAISQYKRTQEALRHAQDGLERRVLQRTEALVRTNEALLSEVTERKRTEEALCDSKEKFTAFMNYTPAVAWMKDEKGNYVYINQTFERLFRITPEGIIGKNDFELWPEVTAKELRENDVLVQSSWKSLETYETVPTPDGLPHFWFVLKFPFKDSLGRRFVGGMAVDVTENKKAEETLRKSEGRFAGILDISSEAIISIDATQRIIIFNKGAEHVFGYSQEEAIGQPLDLLLPERFRAVHRNHVGTFAGSSVPSRRMGERGEIYGRRKSGVEFPAEASISKLEIGDERIFTVVLRDITDRKRWEEALNKQAIHDDLTGLYNRRYFNYRVEEEIARAHRKQFTLALLLCDLDHFKRINDSRGHQAGDQVLKETAKSIRESTRGTDTVFRWGGDEIVVILSETSREGILIASERIRKGIRKISEAMELDLDLSIGVALYPEHGRNVDELIRLADRALYIAKKGGDKVHIGEEEYRLDEHSIKAVFQPVVDVRSNRILGYEALSRDPQGKLSVPELFKKYSAIGQLNDLKQLCFRLQVKTAQAIGLQRVFINVDFDGIGKIEPIPKPPGMEVILEISELEALHDVENHLSVAAKWRKRGYKFAIDDFGAGFISLPFIASLVPEYIKVDRSTMLHAVSSEKFRGFLKPLLQSLREYATEGIIAEGVETEKELKVVKDMGVHLVQGFLLGKPQDLSRH